MSGLTLPKPDSRVWRWAAVRDVIVLAPAYGVPGLASFLSVPILFGSLGAAEYGRWALMFAIGGGVPQVTTSWLEATLVRFGHRDPRRADGRRIAFAALASVLVSGPLTVLVLPIATSAEIASAVALTTAVGLYLLAIARLQSALAFGAISTTATVRSVLGAVLGLTAGATTHRAWVAIAGLAAGYVIGEILAFLVAASRRRVEAPPASSSDRRGTARPERSGAETSRDVATGPPERATYGLASGFNAVANYELSVGDRFILSALRPLSDVGTYTATYALMDLAARFVPAIVLIGVRPRMFRAWDAGEHDRSLTTIASLSTTLTWLVALAAAVLVLASQAIALPVAAALAGPIAFGFGCFVAANTLAIAYNASTRQARLASHAVLGAIANILLNLALIPRLGPAGAAVATGVSYLIVLVANARSIPGLAPRLRAGGVVMISAFAALSLLSTPLVGFDVVVAAALAVVALLPGGAVIASSALRLVQPAVAPLSR